MCMMLNVPPSIEAEVADYERVTGVSLQDMFLSYLESKLATGSSGLEGLRGLRTA